ncbi:hypothetical protein [Streptomyces sp. NPDC047928]|uniref:hypothetical protein n=1 Tax=unclassified Streptomyces TaxID=2593676 RepID=UPI003716C2A0
MTNDPTAAGDSRTETEDRLARALAARAAQVTHHSLRPAAPPAPNWAARGRGPLVLALAAAITSVALVSTAAVSMLTEPEGTGVANTSPSDVPAPPSLTASPSPSTTPSAPASAVAPPAGTTQPVSRSVTVVYGDDARTVTMRTGGGVTAFTLRIDNDMVTAENASDVLTITPDGGSGTLRAGDIKVSLRTADGGWRPVGTTGPSGYEGRLTDADGETIEEGAPRVHELRIALGSSFPQGVTRLRMNAISDGGTETITVSN